MARRRLGVLDHDDPPRLPVPAVGGEAGGVEQPVEGRVVDPGLVELAHCPGRPERSLRSTRAGYAGQSPDRLRARKTASAELTVSPGPGST